MPYYQYYVAKWQGDHVERIKINGQDFHEWGFSSSCNGTKATPCLQADLFGDWREELVLYNGSSNAHLNVFSTNLPTQYRVVTPMHDHIYRMSVAWQNVAYNQPPHLGYYLPDKFKKPQTAPADTTSAKKEEKNNSTNNVEVEDIEDPKR
jgi:rhamnogalacturonan endolyase